MIVYLDTSTILRVLFLCVAATLAASCTRGRPEARPAPPPVDGGTEAMTGSQPASMPPLSPEEAHVILERGTERAFSGKYRDHFETGRYLCRNCGALLYRSEDKFRSSCGWPSFDEEVPGAVLRRPDPDGVRTEIACTACGGHLGHVFEGEGLTPKDTRHCVNSLSLLFRPGEAAPTTVPAAAPPAPAEAYFAGGCFWGVEHHFQQEEGVIEVVSGSMGGHVPHPTYEEVCSGRSGHAETVRVVYDPARVSYETLARLFFEIHDPTELDRQGPDEGTQYRSAVFHNDAAEKATAERLIEFLRAQGLDVVTRIEPAGTFYPAEAYHQDYIEQHPGRRCHARVRRF